jgi:hypothetical protein
MSVDSEVIYWKVVPGDDVYESPITPHHHEHDERYLSFEVRTVCSTVHMFKHYAHTALLLLLYILYLTCV